MIGGDYRRVTTRLKQEEIERVLGVAGTVSSGEGDEVLLQVFETTLSMFEAQVCALAKRKEEVFVPGRTTMQVQDL